MDFLAVFLIGALCGAAIIHFGLKPADPVKMDHDERRELYGLLRQKWRFDYAAQHPDKAAVIPRLDPEAAQAIRHEAVTSVVDNGRLQELKAQVAAKVEEVRSPPREPNEYLDELGVPTEHRR